MTDITQTAMTDIEKLGFMKMFGLSNFKRVASGTYGTVYTCRNRARTVALKFFSNDLYQDAESAAKYCQIEHRIMDHLCQNETPEMRHSPYIYQTTIDKRFGCATVMEYIEGWTVSNYTKEKGQRVTGMSNRTLFRNSMRALRWMHGKGVTHGDLSPANVIITKTGKIMLIDFGFAMTDEDLLTQPEEWRAGNTIYISPEVADMAVLKNQSVSSPSDSESILTQSDQSIPPPSDPELKTQLQKADVWSMCAVFARLECKRLPWSKIVFCEEDMKRVFELSRFICILRDSLGASWQYLQFGFETDWRRRPDASEYLELLNSSASLKRAYNK